MCLPLLLRVAALAPLVPIACIPTSTQEAEAFDSGSGGRDVGLGDRAAGDAGGDGADASTTDAARDDLGGDAGARDTAPIDLRSPDLIVSDRGAADRRAPDATVIDVSAPDTGACFIASPQPVDDRLLPGESAPGQSQAVTVPDGWLDSFHDEYLYNETGETKIGVRREWGGTVVFFGRTDLQDGNTIDGNDTGREVQVAIYDADRRSQNCAHNASCGSTASECPRSITYLGWNPVQGGNRCNRGSGVDAVENADGRLYVRTTPLHWNPNWDRTDCETAACDIPELQERRSEVVIVQELRYLNPRVVELSYVVTNTADMSHAAQHQELPTVYTANGQGSDALRGQDLYRLIDSEGREVAIDDPANDGFYWKLFESPGGWVSMHNATLSYGVGMYYENRTPMFQGWQLRSLPFNNFRAQFRFGLPAFGVVRARAYLLLGSRDEVAVEAAWLDQSLPPFGSFDVPADDAAVAGSQTIAGWALDNRGVSRVELWVDGALAVPLPYGNSRPDVCTVWPGYANCDAVGYHGSFDFSTLTRCQHLLEIKATDDHGNTRVIARKRVTVVAP